MQLPSKRPPPERRRVRRRRTPCPDSICSNLDPFAPCLDVTRAGPRSGEPTGSATRAMTAVPRGKGRSSLSAQPLRRAVSSARPAERSCCPRGSRGPGGRTGREHWALEHQHDARCVPRMAEAARMDDLLPHRARRAVGALSALLISVVASFVASNGVLPWDSMSTVCFVTCMDGLGAHGAAEVRRTRNASLGTPIQLARRGRAQQVGQVDLRHQVLSSISRHLSSAHCRNERRPPRSGPEQPRPHLQRRLVTSPGTLPRRRARS